METSTETQNSDPADSSGGREASYLGLFLIVVGGSVYFLIPSLFPYFLPAVVSFGIGSSASRYFGKRWRKPWFEALFLALQILFLSFVFALYPAPLSELVAAAVVGGAIGALWELFSIRRRRQTS